MQVVRYGEVEVGHSGHSRLSGGVRHYVDTAEVGFRRVGQGGHRAFVGHVGHVGLYGDGLPAHRLHFVRHCVGEVLSAPQPTTTA
ncbi:hypothetical protein AQI95_05415 [Streptomyces yokosukanensis]|uniref:Uncharacterized protein n=1 Tax=Streptomyces yokosukanensis TaxID=67386 RepID=A0A101PD18_9ACTN|nr:hypothetical protein AQI95_05415 [Streptomyces yokosukanensis]